MRRLFLTLRSPYARKVQLLLAELDLPVESVVVDLANRTAEFNAVNPHGKVPALVDEDGTVVVDSTVICEYLLDRYGSRPDGWQARLAVRELDELGDGLADQAIAVFFGRQAGDAARAEKAERVGGRLLDTLEARVSPDGAPLLGQWSHGDAAVLAALGYWTFRLGDGWRTSHPRLAAWFDAMDARPNAAATRPRL